MTRNLARYIWSTSCFSFSPPSYWKYLLTKSLTLYCSATVSHCFWRCLCSERLEDSWELFKRAGDCKEFTVINTGIRIVCDQLSCKRRRKGRLVVVVAVVNRTSNTWLCVHVHVRFTVLVVNGYWWYLLCVCPGGSSQSNPTTNNQLCVMKSVCHHYTLFLPLPHPNISVKSFRMYNPSTAISAYNSFDWRHVRCYNPPSPLLHIRPTYGL